MKKSIATIAAMSALTLALTGCSSEEAAPETTQAGQPTTEATTENTGSGLTQEEWFNLCGSEGSDPSDPLCEADKNIDPIDDGSEAHDMYGYIEPHSEWFTFTTTDENDILEKWEVRIDSAEMTSSLEGAADNPDYYSGDDLDAPEQITAETGEGTEFLRVDYRVKNTIGKPEYLALEASALFTDGEEYAALGDDVTYGENLTAAQDMPAGDTQNPNTETTGVFVIALPEDSDIEGLIIRDMYIGSYAEVLVDLPL